MSSASSASLPTSLAVAAGDSGASKPTDDCCVDAENYEESLDSLRILALAGAGAKRDHESMKSSDRQVGANASAGPSSAAPPRVYRVRFTVKKTPRTTSSRVPGVSATAASASVDVDQEIVVHAGGIPAEPSIASDKEGVTASSAATAPAVATADNSAALMDDSENLEQQSEHESELDVQEKDARDGLVVFARIDGNDEAFAASQEYSRPQPAVAALNKVDEPDTLRPRGRDRELQTTLDRVGVSYGGAMRMHRELLSNLIDQAVVANGGREQLTWVAGSDANHSVVYRLVNSQRKVVYADVLVSRASLALRGHDAVPRAVYNNRSDRYSIARQHRLAYAANSGIGYVRFVNYGVGVVSRLDVWRLGGSSKRRHASAIGRYGEGANVVAHTALRLSHGAVEFRALAEWDGARIERWVPVWHTVQGRQMLRWVAAHVDSVPASSRTAGDARHRATDFVATVWAHRDDLHVPRPDEWTLLSGQRTLPHCAADVTRVDVDGIGTLMLRAADDVPAARRESVVYARNFLVCTSRSLRHCYNLDNVHPGRDRQSFGGNARRRAIFEVLQAALIAQSDVVAPALVEQLAMPTACEYEDLQLLRASDMRVECVALLQHAFRRSVERNVHPVLVGDTRSERLLINMYGAAIVVRQVPSRLYELLVDERGGASAYCGDVSSLVARSWERLIATPVSAAPSLTHREACIAVRVARWARQCFSTVADSVRVTVREPATDGEGRSVVGGANGLATGGEGGNAGDDDSALSAVVDDPPPLMCAAWKMESSASSPSSSTVGESACRLEFALDRRLLGDPEMRAQHYAYCGESDRLAASADASAEDRCVVFSVLSQHMMRAVSAVIDEAHVQRLRTNMSLEFFRGMTALRSVEPIEERVGVTSGVRENGVRRGDAASPRKTNNGGDNDDVDDSDRGDDGVDGVDGAADDTDNICASFRERAERRIQQVMSQRRILHVFRSTVRSGRRRRGSGGGDASDDDDETAPSEFDVPYWGRNIRDPIPLHDARECIDYLCRNFCARFLTGRASQDRDGDDNRDGEFRDFQLAIINDADVRWTMANVRHPDDGDETGGEGLGGRRRRRSMIVFNLRALRKAMEAGFDELDGDAVIYSLMCQAAAAAKLGVIASSTDLVQMRDVQNAASAFLIGCLTRCWAFTHVSRHGALPRLIDVAHSPSS